jgi:hypothetical protein
VKIFWSWQSDTPGKIGRHFVRDVLRAAIDDLKQAIEVDEPTERDARADIHLDHDREGVSGSPDLSRVILEKIAQSVVFVADVTPVGFVHERPDTQSSKIVKKVINPNVAIELGYALRALTDRALLMVLNEHYGGRADLPFDLQSKAGPITFRLAPDAEKAVIAAEARSLKSKLVEALRLCLADRAKSSSVEPQPFPEAPVGANPAMFFERDEVLAGFGYPGEQEYRLDGEKFAYLRLFPSHANQPSVGLARLTTIFEARKPYPMSMTIGGLTARNRYGPIIIDPIANTSIAALTQGFASGELWGINGKLYVPYRIQVGFPPRPTDALMIPMVTLERIYVRALNNYVSVAASELKLQFPYTIELGLVGLEDTYLAIPGGLGGQGEIVGPILQDTLQLRFSLDDDNEASIMGLLRSYFIKVYDLAARERSSVLTDQLISGYGLPPR